MQQNQLKLTQHIVSALPENKDDPKGFKVTPNPFHDANFIEHNNTLLEEQQKNVLQFVKDKPKFNKEQPVIYPVKHNTIVRNITPLYKNQFQSPDKSELSISSQFEVQQNPNQISFLTRKNNVISRFNQVQAERASLQNHDKTVMETKCMSPEVLQQQILQLQLQLQQLQQPTQEPQQENDASLNQIDLEPVEIVNN